MKIFCTKRIEFDAAHRVPSHDGMCRMLHGHRYAVEATFTTKQLNNMGMIIDFSIIKTKLKLWIDQHWDHNTILDVVDIELGKMIQNSTGQKVFYLQNHPTAENLAIFLLCEVCPAIFIDYKEIYCSKIRIYETPNSFAEALHSKSLIE